tara:strand:+ start:563 stop:970 length:408 start_codon:yes stop_codon:yes gene_type:complete
MIGLVISCVLFMPLSIDDMTNYIQCRNEEKKITYVQQWQPLISKYFKHEDVKQAMLIVYCESRGLRTAKGVNTNGTNDIGLWQFNDKTWEWLTTKLKISGYRTNTETSTYLAAWLAYNSGWHHWSSSQHCWKGDK